MDSFAVCISKTLLDKLKWDFKMWSSNLQKWETEMEKWEKED